MKKEIVYLDNEQTKKEMDIQKIVKEEAEKERKNGRKVKIGYQKITIDGKIYEWISEKERETMLSGDFQFWFAFS